MTSHWLFKRLAAIIAASALVATMLVVAHAQAQPTVQRKAAPIPPKQVIKTPGKDRIHVVQVSGNTYRIVGVGRAARPDLKVKVVVKGDDPQVVAINWGWLWDAAVKAYQVGKEVLGGKGGCETATTSETTTSSTNSGGSTSTTTSTKIDTKTSCDYPV